MAFMIFIYYNLVLSSIFIWTFSYISFCVWLCVCVCFSFLLLRMWMGLTTFMWKLLDCYLWQPLESMSHHHLLLSFYKELPVSSKTTLAFSMKILYGKILFLCTNYSMKPLWVSFAFYARCYINFLISSWNLLDIYEKTHVLMIQVFVMIPYQGLCRFWGIYWWLYFLRRN